MTLATPRNTNASIAALTALIYLAAALVSQTVAWYNHIGVWFRDLWSCYSTDSRAAARRDFRADGPAACRRNMPGAVIWLCCRCMDRPLAAASNSDCC